jgi:hypothetical protein
MSALSESNAEPDPEEVDAVGVETVPDFEPERHSVLEPVVDTAPGCLRRSSET